MKSIEAPPHFANLVQALEPQHLVALVRSGNATPGGRYRHWEKLRRLTPPDGLSHEQWWLAIKIARFSNVRKLPLNAKDGSPFHYVMVDSLFEQCHEIDQGAGGMLGQSEPDVLSNEQRDQYLVSSLIEEAITSSQLEGAATTRRVAKEMLRSGREPRDRDERMIRNNYRAMEFVRQNKEAALDDKFVFRLHEVLTEGTLETPDAAGRLRRQDEHVQVWDEEESCALHDPPPGEELPARMAAMYTFANTNGTPFIHPVVRAVLLHFWLAYDHPFVDGNGRTARALFYWAMLRDGYWLTEFISISSILKKARTKYFRSFLYSESDDNDATYFVLSQLDVIRQAIGQLHKYIERKTREQRKIVDLLKTSKLDLNHRQIALLMHAVKRPNEVYTVGMHKNSHKISYQTARTDLLSLRGQGLLLQRRLFGKTMAFVAPPDLEKRLRK